MFGSHHDSLTPGWVSTCPRAFTCSGIGYYALIILECNFIYVFLLGIKVYPIYVYSSNIFSDGSSHFFSMFHVLIFQVYDGDVCYRDDGLCQCHDQVEKAAENEKGKTKIIFY